MGVGSPGDQFNENWRFQRFEFCLEAYNEYNYDYIDLWRPGEILKLQTNECIRPIPNIIESERDTWNPEGFL